MDNDTAPKEDRDLGLTAVPAYREDIYVKRFRKVRRGHPAAYDTCTCCGSGIARVHVLSNGWRLGPACVKARTTRTARDIRYGVAGRKYLTVAATRPSRPTHSSRPACPARRSGTPSTAGSCLPGRESSAKFTNERL